MGGWKYYEGIPTLFKIKIWIFSGKCCKRFGDMSAVLQPNRKRRTSKEDGYQFGTGVGKSVWRVSGVHH